MYMPLCRECHARESKLNTANAYIGDPSKISADLEKKQFQQKVDEKPATSLSSTVEKINNKVSPTSSLTVTTASNDSPNAKGSFTSSEDSLERAAGEQQKQKSESSINLLKVNQASSSNNR